MSTVSEEVIPTESMTTEEVNKVSIDVLKLDEIVNEESTAGKRKLEETDHQQESTTEDEPSLKNVKLSNEGQPQSDQEEKPWLPPTITTIENPLQFNTSTYHSPIPKVISENVSQPVVLGVDEAGRGPVLGPMVYGLSYCLVTYQSGLKTKYGFADSKVLKDTKRLELFKLIEEQQHELNDNVGYATTIMTAKDISSGMLQSSHGNGAYNLNEQAHDTTINLIKQVLQKGVNVTKIFIDTVGPPATYQAKLRKIFPEVEEITVTKKADSIYPIVSTASVVAKVTRDLNIEYFNQDAMLSVVKGNIGSRYPSDPNTSRWLNSNVDNVFGWCFGFVRFSWQTAKDALVKHNAAEVIYEEQCLKEDYLDVMSLFDKKIDGKLNKNYYNTNECVL